MRNNVRSAIIGALTAIFVVALAFAPKFTSHPTTINVHNTSDEEALVEETTTTTVPETTTTTEAPTTTTEIIPPLVIEAPSTTTTTTQMPPTFYSEGMAGSVWRITLHASTSPVSGPVNVLVQMKDGSVHAFTTTFDKDGGGRADVDIDPSLLELPENPVQWYRDGSATPTFYLGLEN